MNDKLRLSSSSSTHNAGRSLAAKVLLDHTPSDRVEVRSAGSDPGSELNASVVTLLEERGLDPRVTNSPRL